MTAVVAAANAFKGTLSPQEACAAMAAGVRQGWPDAEVRVFPMADGGDGTLDVLAACLGAALVPVAARDALGRPLEAHYGRLAAGGEIEALFEAARVVGLAGAPGRIEQRHTGGLGDLLRHALDQGLRRFLCALGGTSTNEGGAGLLSALGARFLDRDGHLLPPTLQGLARVESVDFTTLDPRLAECRLVVLADVDSPLLGPQGATLAYGPQKGIPADRIRLYEGQLARLAGLYARALGRDHAPAPGSGAAGGLGLALLALGGVIESGAEAVARHHGLAAAVRDAAWVVTGEGRSDLQTVRGKAPWVVARHARAAGVPVSLVSGQVAPEALPVLGRRFAGCHALDESGGAPPAGAAFPRLAACTAQVAAAQRAALMARS